MTARAACGGLRLRHRERPRPHCNVTEIKRNLVKRTKWYKRKHSFATTNHICTALMYTHIYGMLFKTHRDSEIPNGGCIRDFVLPGMERGKGAVSTGHRGSLENSGSRISGKQRSERKTCAKMCENLARWRKLRIETLVRKRFFLAYVALRRWSASTGGALAARLS